MNKSVKILSIMFASLCCVACHVAKRSQVETDVLLGDGNVVTREIPITDYNIIIADNPVEIHYVESKAEPYLKITADSNIIAALAPRVWKKRLLLTRYWPRYDARRDVTFLPTVCVVETNSKHLKGVGTNAIDLGETNYNLSHDLSRDICRSIQLIYQLYRPTSTASLRVAQQVSVSANRSDKGAPLHYQVTYDWRRTNEDGEVLGPIRYKGGLWTWETEDGPKSVSASVDGLHYRACWSDDTHYVVHSFHFNEPDDTFSDGEDDEELEVLLDEMQKMLDDVQ